MASRTWAEGGPVSALLTGDDPPPVRIFNPQGASAFLLLGDHAGNSIPSRLGTLGLSNRERARHIAWDIGVTGLGERLADTLDATFIAQRYSRLVVDCNRDPASPEAVLEISDSTAVPDNCGLPIAERQERVAAIHDPYHSAIAAEIARRTAAGRPTVLVALHSFTPVMAGFSRPWHIGVLQDGGDTSFATALLGHLRSSSLVVAANEPYRMDDTDYTVPRHAYGARLPYAEIEVRQDLLADLTGCEAISRILATALIISFREMP